MYRGQIFIPWIIHKMVINEQEQFNAILVLIERIYFPQRGAQERGLTKLHHGGKCRVVNHWADILDMTTLV